MFVVIADEDAPRHLINVSIERCDPAGGGTQAVAEVQDYIDRPEHGRCSTSDDGQATYIAVGLPSAVGSPESDQTSGGCALSWQISTPRRVRRST